MRGLAEGGPAGNRACDPSGLCGIKTSGLFHGKTQILHFS